MKRISILVIAIVAASAFVTSTKAATILFFDFGDGSQTTPGNYNNLITSVPQTLSVTNAIDSAGAPTNIDVTLTGFAVGADTNGTTTPSGEAAIFDSHATRDDAFGHASISSIPELAFQDLDLNSVYEFTFFASHVGTSDNLETKITVNGQASTNIIFLNAANNNSNVGVVSNVHPGTMGSVIVHIEAGPNNNGVDQLGYLGALRLVATPEPTGGILTLTGFVFLMLKRSPRRN